MMSVIHKLNELLEQKLNKKKKMNKFDMASFT